MGQFSWLDCQTREQILDDEYEGYKLVSKEYVTPVKVAVDNNTLYKYLLPLR